MTSFKRQICPAMLSPIDLYLLDADDQYSTTALASSRYKKSYQIISNQPTNQLRIKSHPTNQPTNRTSQHVGFFVQKIGFRRKSKIPGKNFQL